MYFTAKKKDGRTLLASMEIASTPESILRARKLATRLTGADPQITDDIEWFNCLGEKDYGTLEISADKTGEQSVECEPFPDTSDINIAPIEAIVDQWVNELIDNETFYSLFMTMAQVCGNIDSREMPLDKNTALDLAENIFDIVNNSDIRLWDLDPTAADVLTAFAEDVKRYFPLSFN